MLNYFAFLMLTVAIELPVAWLLLKFDNVLQKKRNVLLVVLALNLITHPFAWGAYGLMLANWIVIEFIVVLIEALAVWSLTERNLRLAVGLSLITNCMSMAAGIAIGTLR